MNRVKLNVKTRPPIVDRHDKPFCGMCVPWPSRAVIFKLTKQLQATHVQLYMPQMQRSVLLIELFQGRGMCCMA